MENEKKEKTNNILKILCALVIILIAVILYAVSKPSQLKTSPAITTTTTGIDLQTKCADSASKYFKDSGYDKTIQRDQINSYTNHWNTKIGKCLVLITSTWSVDINKEFTLMKDETLMDAIEGKLYGEFTSQGTSWLDRQVMGCNMYENGDGLNNNGQQCKSEEEFNTFVSPLMAN